MKTIILTIGLLAAASVNAQTINEGDFKIKNFKFTDGEQIDTLNLHHRTCGKPVTDKKGKTTNAVLIMHGTGGSSKRKFSASRMQSSS